MNRSTIGLLAVAVLILPSSGQAQGRLVKLAPHAWAWISGNDGSSNGALFVGDSIAALVDPGASPALTRAFVAAAREVTDRPIRHAILTHWHPDHSLGVTCFAGRRFTVWAQDAARRAIEERGAAVAKAFAGRATSAADQEELGGCRVAAPDSSITERRTLDLGGRRLEIFHPGHAHTPGDLVVWEPGERVLATGDVFMHRASPDMSESRPSRWAVVLDSLVALRPNGVVAGHFGPSEPGDLVRFRDYLEALIAAVMAALDRGVAPDQVAAAVTLPDFADFAQYPAFGATIQRNAARVVAELRPPR